jgi:hypothetical protein
MNNPETLATLATQDTGLRQAKIKTQHRKLKRYDVNKIKDKKATKERKD